MTIVVISILNVTYTSPQRGSVGNTLLELGDFWEVIIVANSVYYIRSAGELN